ncbi:hypothetical protein CBR_g29971 [Chara braunii]|uniref:Reverse transcriptase domain-containing protein n=1 Tax=Chara braunii TaxID=69332 RepID=A0A388LBK4_CHABU|nr:hypothetical protein CBR_g29971 [Chara braunii]|eukprot:GBG79707.1 hypothetical protein CBR_g29971 [Chara braunii]
MGICNAPATFQGAMNMTFQNFVNKTRLTQGMINFCVIVYMDDILVYSETYHGHAQHIEWTLGALRDAGFKIALEKSEFFLSEISLLGYVVTRGGLRPDSRKVAAVKEAPVPTSLTQLWREDFVELSLCLVEVRLTWTEDEARPPCIECLELLFIQAWRTNVEGELLAFLFGTVRPRHQELIAQELAIPIAQLADELPLDIISQDDEHPIPHVLSRTLTPYLQWSACVEGAAARIPPSQQQYLDPRTVCDPAFFRHPAAEQLAAIREEEEEEESTESDEGEDEREESGKSDEVLGEEDETPEEGNYSKHSEGEQSEEEEEDDEGKEENEGPTESEWEAAPEETMRTGTEAEDPEAARKREETAAGKRELEFASGASLHENGLPLTYEKHMFEALQWKLGKADGSCEDLMHSVNLQRGQTSTVTDDEDTGGTSENGGGRRKADTDSTEGYKSRRTAGGSDHKRRSAAESSSDASRGGSSADIAHALVDANDRQAERIAGSFAQAMDGMNKTMAEGNQTLLQCFAMLSNVMVGQPPSVPPGGGTLCKRGSRHEDGR